MEGTLKILGPSDINLACFTLLHASRMSRKRDAELVSVYDLFAKRMFKIYTVSVKVPFVLFIARCCGI